MVNTYSTLKGKFEAFEMNMTPKSSDDFIIAAALAAHRKWYEHFRRVMKITYVLISPETIQYRPRESMFWNLQPATFADFTRKHPCPVLDKILARDLLVYALKDTSDEDA